MKFPTLHKCCSHRNIAGALVLAGLALLPFPAYTDSTLPIADAHIHYSHDSVDLTPPERVIEIMREANLKFALVSSSDDNGTQLLSKLAPDLIIPGLRPYRKRGETQTWFRDQGALDYVEKLLANNRYASIGEFHLFGEDVELPIPRRIVELAEKFNLVLHAHSDSDAVERLLAQNDSVKIIWAHSGFDSPAEIADMLSKHDRLWADLAFRSEVGSGGSLSDDWRALFEAHPDRMMLGTDTYTPERMYFIPEHASASRVWLKTLPNELAEKIAWKNAYSLLMPIWNANKGNSIDTDACLQPGGASVRIMQGDVFSLRLEALSAIEVSSPVSLLATVCESGAGEFDMEFDATMPAHGHSMNYKPTLTALTNESGMPQFRIDGVLLHMPGNWQFTVDVRGSEKREKISQTIEVN